MKVVVKTCRGDLFGTDRKLDHQRILKYRMDLKNRVVTLNVADGSKIIIPFENIDAVTESMEAAEPLELQ